MRLVLLVYLVSNLHSQFYRSLLLPELDKIYVICCVSSTNWFLCSTILTLILLSIHILVS